MANESNLDVKLGTSSSEAAKAQETVKASTTQTGDVKPAESMSDIVAQVAKKHDIELPEPSSGKEKKAESSVQKLNETQKKEKEAGKEETASTETKEKGEENERQGDESDVSGSDKTAKGEEGSDEIDPSNPPEHVPYERFQKVTASKAELETKWNEVEPLVKAHNEIVDYCARNGVTEAQYSRQLEIAALINTNPALAVQKLTELTQELQGFTGDRLPADLQKKVDDGNIELADAKELAQLRARGKMTESQLQFEKQKHETARQQEHNRALVTAADDWGTSKMQADADFQPKKLPNAPDGKYEFFTDRVKALFDKTNEKGQPVYPINDAKAVIQVLELAYSQVNASFARFTPKNTPKKVVSSTSSSVGAEHEPKSMDDIRLAVAKKHGIGT